MQFQIPQFIEVEDKIAGPLGLRQLLYLVVGGIICAFSFFLLATWLSVIIIPFVAAISLAFAFLKFNGQPLPKIALAAFFFLWKPRLYIWQRETVTKTIKFNEEDATVKRDNLKKFASEMPSVKKLWNDILTSKNPIPKREKGNVLPTIAERFSAFRKLTGEKEVAKRIDYR